MTFPTYPKSTALAFNECISNADIEALSGLMTDDHVFIDTANNRIEGKSGNLTQAWIPFFDRYPGYRNIFEKIIVKDTTVIMQGYSICSDENLNNVHAIWIAEIADGKVSR